MGLFRKKIEKKAITGGMMVFPLPSQGWPTIDYRRLAEEGYKRNFAVYACVNEIAKAVASIKWLLFDKSGKEIEDSPLLDLLSRPKPRQGGHAFLQSVMSYLLISGNSYVKRVGPNEGPPLNLYCLRPDRVEILPAGNSDEVIGYKYTVKGKVELYAAEEILHLKLFNPLDDFLGMSPLEAAALSVDSLNEAGKWNYSLLKNSGRPSGALKVEGEIDPGQKEFLRTQFAEANAGGENAGKPFLFEGGMSWEEMGLSPKDMDFKEGKVLAVREICAAYNVPPELIGDPANKTFSNYQEARKAFYQETVLPYMDFLRDEFNVWLTPLFGEGLKLDYDKDAIEALREDRAVAWDRAERGTRAGVISPNEGRDLLGYEKAGPEADKLYVGANMTPMDAVAGNDFTGPA